MKHPTDMTRDELVAHVAELRALLGYLVEFHLADVTHGDLLDEVVRKAQRILGGGK